MKTKTQFKQEMRKHFREVVDKVTGETFISWFDNLWAELEANGQVIRISGTNYVMDGSESEPKSSVATCTADATQELKETVKAAIIKGHTDVGLIDLRNFRDIVKAAVSEESSADENWAWSVKAINKFRVKIGWGYTDSMGEKAPFSVRIETGWVENPVVIGSERRAGVPETRRHGHQHLLRHLGIRRPDVGVSGSAGRGLPCRGCHLCRERCPAEVEHLDKRKLSNSRGRGFPDPLCCAATE